MNPSGSKKRTDFIITVDTETYSLAGKPPLFGPNIYGEYGGEEFGVARIMDISEKYGAKTTFFVDVYMHQHYGKEPVRDLCRGIARRGHDVQLHAHLSWLPGSKSDFLYDYSLESQRELLKEGKELIGEWTGQAPVAFRAGSYSANLDTMRALSDNGFRLDSSYFARRTSCQLSRQLENRYANRIFRIGEVTEVPVTTYWLVDKGPYRKLSKLDFNACSLAELRDVVPKLIDAGTRTVVLFLHSFSFVRWTRDLSGIVPNYRAMDRFDRLLAEIARRDDAGFITMEQASRMALSENDEGSDFIPTVRMSRLVPRVMQRMLE
jgi:peptidoglycan/xylan/chitin deacetylase (PgdA/CDA1 family)